MTDAQMLRDKGRKEIRETQVKHNKIIDAAPISPAWDHLQRKPKASKRQCRQAKDDAIRDIIQDFAVLGVELLAVDEAKALDDEV